MPSWSREGTVDRETLVVGPWTELYAEVGGVTLRIGSVLRGRLRIKRKNVVHYGTRSRARLPDMAQNTMTGMEFEGMLREVHRENILWLLDRPPDEAKPAPGAIGPTGGEITIQDPHYPAQFFTLYGKRPYAGGTDEVVFAIHKCRQGDIIKLMSGNRVKGVRFRTVGLSDVDGDYGGSEGAPYGWIFGKETVPPVPPTPPSGRISTHATLPTDLVLHYSCEDNAGNWVVTDDTPNAYHGTSSVQTQWMSDPGGIINNCFLNHFINVPDIRPEFGNHGTFVMWLKSRVAISPNWGFNNMSPTDNEAYPWLNGIVYIGTFRNGSRISFVPDAGIDRTQWHMFTITQTPGANGYKVYQNLTEVFSGAGEAAVTLHSTPQIGKSIGGIEYDGRKDQIAVWSRVLTASERADLYNGGAGLPY